jgi:hypothetical protein
MSRSVCSFVATASLQEKRACASHGMRNQVSMIKEKNSGSCPGG